MDALEKQLTEIFAPNKSGLGGTGYILTQPTSIDASIARAVAAEVDMDQLAAAAGVVAARVLADALEQRALRPADYSDMPEVCQTMAERLVKLLPKSEAFQKAFYDALRLRG
jgi:hypothetical protein